MKPQKRKSGRRGKKTGTKVRAHKKKTAVPRKQKPRKESAMSEEKSLLNKIFGWGKKKEEPPKESMRKEPAQKPTRKNEFAEDEKTIDGVVRQLRSDLEKDLTKQKKR